VKVIVYW